MLELPAGINTLDGTGSTVELLLETEKVKPADGATDPFARLIVICVVPPPVTVDGLAVTVPKAGGGGGAAPVEFTNPTKLVLAPIIDRAISGLPSRLKSSVTILPPPVLVFVLGTT